MSRKKTPGWVKATADKAEATSKGLDPHEGVEVPLHMQARKPAARKAKETKRSASKPAPAEAAPATVADPIVDHIASAVVDAARAVEGRGRPTKYKPEYAVIAREMCRLGATDYDLAQRFDVVTSTIWSWQARFPDFSNALRTEKGAFDDRVERSLAQRAVGYSYSATKVMQHNGRPVYADYVEHIPPDPGAAKLWLTNRRGGEWREKSETTLKGDGFMAFWRAMAEGPGALDALLKAGPPQA